MTIKKKWKKGKKPMNTAQQDTSPSSALILKEDRKFASCTLCKTSSLLKWSCRLSASFVTPLTQPSSLMDEVPGEALKCKWGSKWGSRLPVGCWDLPKSSESKSTREIQHCCCSSGQACSQGNQGGCLSLSRGS